MYAGPKIIKDDSLGVIVDATSTRAVPDTYNTNLIDYSTWTVGNTSATGFSRNGDSTENIIEYNTGPFGESAVIWAGRNNTTSSNSDGGWNGGQFDIDHTSLYRFSVWVYREVQGNGSFYIGLRGYDVNGGNIGVRSRTNNSNSTNPYFWSGGITTGQGWQLFVGHVWPSSYAAGSNHPDSGRYNTSTGKFGSITRDYVWNATNTRALHRSYLYYSTDPATVQLWAYPRVDKIDGTEPTVDDLLNGGNRGIVNLSNPNEKIFLPNKLTRSSATNLGKQKVKKFSFDSTNDFIKVTGGNHTSLKRTIEIIFRVNSAPFTYSPIAVYTRESGGIETYQRTWLGIQSSKFQMHGWGTTDPASTSSVTDGSYYHCVYAYDQTTKQHYIWVNGALETVQTNTQAGQTGWNNSSNLNWWLGRDPQAAAWTAAAGSYFDGDIAVFKTYSTVLTDKQVKQNFRAYKNRFNLS